MLILLTAGCFVYAETAIWINGSGDRDWSATSNWVPGVPQSADTAIINSTFEGPIIHGGVKAADTVKLGDAGSGQAYLYLNAGSILNVGSTCSIGQESDGILHINGGFLDVVLGGGDTVGNVSVGGPDGGNGTVQMTGGTIQTWDMGVGLYSGNGTVTINDGVIEVLNPAGGLSMTARGLINIKAGSIILDGDQTVTCSSYMSSGRIIAYDGSGSVLVDYDSVNSGKTTVWATSPSFKADIDGSKKVDLSDLLYVAGTWLDDDPTVRPVGDISGDMKVDFADMSRLAGEWLAIRELDFMRFIGPEDCPGVSQFADPYVFKENDAFYLTSTYTVGIPMYMFCTSDFSNKERYTLNLDLNESYLRAYFGDPGLVAYHVWGFVPYKHTDNSWHAYASIHVGDSQTFVCHLSPDGSSTWPITDWRLDKVLAGSPSDIAYESKIYSDASGLYLLYVDTLGDGNNHIMARKMLDPDDVDTSFTPRAILSPEGLSSEDRTPPGGMQIVEGQNIAHVDTPTGSKYVMLYSVGDYAESNYKLGVAYSDVLIPSAGQTYDKPKDFDSLNVWQNPGPRNEVVYTLQTQIAEWPNYHGDLFNGPGLGNLVEYLDHYYIVFHARDPGQTGSGDGRWTWICPATIDFSEPMHSWVVPKPKLMTNGDFEADGDSWGSTPFGWTEDFDSYGVVWQFYSGSRGLHPGDGGPPGGCYQDIATRSGKWYEMSLWIQNFDGASGTGNVKVLVGNPGTDVYTFENGSDTTNKYSSTGLVDMNFSTGIPWNQVTLSFQATGSITRIGVYNAPFSGDFSTNVDDVSVKAAD